MTSRRRTYTGLVVACSLMALAAVVATAVVVLRPPLPTAPTPAAAVAPAAPATSADGSAPVVGWAGWAPGTTGYGSARPSELGANGDGTSVVWDITWQSWGGATAIGHGSASWLPPAGASAAGRPTRAVVVASDLGDCHGRYGYRTVAWYFPSKGETVADATEQFDHICSTS